MSSLPINLDLIRTRSADIRRELEMLRAHAALPEDAFSVDPEKVRAARYSLTVVVEAAAAICNHLVTRQSRVSESYPGCFQLLGELGIVDASLATRLAAMARLRNLLVHGYGRVDDRRLHQVLRQDLDDLEAFLAAVGIHALASGGESP